MKNPIWDEEGWDRTTFAPFALLNALDTEWKDVRLAFEDWDWLKQTHGTDTIDDYYLNGTGVQGLVLAARLTAGLEAVTDGMECDSEGDTCYIHFKTVEEAVKTAELAFEMIQDEKKIRSLIPVSDENEFDL